MFIETHTLSWKFMVCKLYYILLSAYHRSQKVFKCILILDHHSALLCATTLNRFAVSLFACNVPSELKRVVT